MVILICAVLTLYFLGRIVSVMSVDVETVAATWATIDDAVTATGYFVRNETVVAGTAGETVEHTVHSGEKISKSSALAVEYTSRGALETSRKVQQLDEQIALLDSVLNTATDVSDTARLDQLITMNMQQLADRVHDGVVGELTDPVGELRRLTLCRGVSGQDIATLQQQTDNLKKQRNNLAQSILKQTKTISSPYDGFFSETVDGYEQILRASDIPNLTADGFAEKIKTEPKPQNAALGKIVQGFDWYFAALVPSSVAEKTRVGAQVALRFNQLAEDVPAVVYAVRPAKDGEQTLLLFQSNRINSDLVTMRRQQIDIIRATYTGLKIPKEAIRVQDEQMGVYTLNGSISRFKKITPVYEGDTFYVIAQSNKDENGVVAQDNIITKGLDLEDKKVVKK